MRTLAAKPKHFPRRAIAFAIALGAVGTASARLPHGFEVVSTVSTRIDDGLGEPLISTYREIYQEVDGEVFVQRDHYTGNLRRPGFSWRMGGRADDVLESLDPPVSGHFTRYARTNAGIDHGILDPVYRPSVDDAEAFRLSAGSPPASPIEVAGKTYRIEVNPQTKLASRLQVTYPSRGMKTIVVGGFADYGGVTLPKSVDRDETFGSGGEQRTHAQMTLTSFRPIDRLANHLSVQTLEPGARVKDTIKGTYYEVLGPNRFRAMGTIPKPKGDRPGPVSQRNGVLLFTALVGSAFLILGWNVNSKAREKGKKAA